MKLIRDQIADEIEERVWTPISKQAHSQADDRVLARVRIYVGSEYFRNQSERHDFERWCTFLRGIVADYINQSLKK
jgi:hypothetical protein